MVTIIVGCGNKRLIAVVVKIARCSMPVRPASFRMSAALHVVRLHSAEGRDTVLAKKRSSRPEIQEPITKSVYLKLGSETF